jgi:hypothetical protein
MGEAVCLHNPHAFMARAGTNVTLLVHFTAIKGTAIAWGLPILL